MRSPLTFFVTGDPKGQPRARACRRGAFSGVYDPGTADAWKWAVRAVAQDAWDKAKFTGPLCLNLTFYFRRPKGHFRSNGQLKDTAPSFHTSKPDRDNLDKAVMDALTTLGVWDDDCQVVEGRIRKLYSSDGTTGAWVEIREATA